MASITTVLIQEHVHEKFDWRGILRERDTYRAMTQTITEGSTVECSGYFSIASDGHPVLLPGKEIESLVQAPRSIQLAWQDSWQRYHQNVSKRR